ncbi:uncharacterized protein GIQ15_05388 [Arthroderma uncinatum]|uniref:uncharacterized protein n=1 Tax=Arthroderma uncinatum TaxID=74035 RepID=UPI00144ACA0A|nr:uncharacterized protein GIQ15_05388 [Arthroderma uncinatum]KAF3480041.1 hypothetical protein GIQ15_05388 [Arthroderma uncinatum]
MTTQARNQVINAPSDEAPRNATSVFLAGTTSRVDARDWREVICTALSDTPVTIYNPYRADWDSSWREDINFAPYREQVEWELEKQERANIVVVYFHPSTQAPVSLLEFGLCARTPGKAIVVCPEGREYARIINRPDELEKCQDRASMLPSSTMYRSIPALLAKNKQVIIKGSDVSYRVLKTLGDYNFQASIQENESSQTTPSQPKSVNPYSLVVMKTGLTPALYQRELDFYKLNCIRSSPYIQPIREIIDNEEDRCMVFDSMGCHLPAAREQMYERGPVFIAALAKSLLEAVKVFSDMDGKGPHVHTDIQPYNITVSDANAWNLSIKLGNLSRMIASGSIAPFPVQRRSIRAPEIWKGGLVTPACDVWSVGVCLAQALIPPTRPLFGNLDFVGLRGFAYIKVDEAAWCIGKIIRLLGPLKRDELRKHKEEFDLAETLAENGSFELGTLEEELAKIDLPPDCIAFIRYLLDTDHTTRPTAKEALRHPWLKIADKKPPIYEAFGQTEVDINPAGFTGQFESHTSHCIIISHTLITEMFLPQMTLPE